MKLTLSIAVICASIFAKAEDQITILKEFCEMNQSDYWVKNSVACRLVRGEYNLDKLCEGDTKSGAQISTRLQAIVDKYAELKSIDSDSALLLLCAKQIGPEAIAAKPECVAERDSKQQVSRKWWDGKAWVTTNESPTAIRTKADKGDRTALFNLGSWYLNGADCLVRDIKVAAPFLCQAFDMGEQMAGPEIKKIIDHPSATKAREFFGKKYGCELTDHQKAYAAETKKLEAKAKELLKKAEAGDVSAMAKVAVVYQATEEGLLQDFKKAFYWAEKSAKKGNVEGMGLLAALYNRGDGVEKSNEKAFEWFLKAAKGGDVDSMYVVGLNFYDGQGTEEDLTKAVQWLVKAMDHGHSEAQEKLAEMYVRGELQAVAFKSLSERLKKLESKK